MNKDQLISAVAVEADDTKKTTLKIVNALLDVVSDQLKNGEEVKLIGFGTFSTSKRAARKGINPSTGESLDIPETVVPKFTPGRSLKDIVKSQIS